MGNVQLDLSKPNCHVCGQPLFRDIESKAERCICFGCSVRNIRFSIPVIMQQPVKSKPKQSANQKNKRIKKYEM